MKKSGKKVIPMNYFWLSIEGTDADSAFPRFFTNVLERKQFFFDKPSRSLMFLFVDFYRFLEISRTDEPPPPPRPRAIRRKLVGVIENYNPLRIAFGPVEVSLISYPLSIIS